MGKIREVEIRGIRRLPWIIALYLLSLPTVAYLMEPDSLDWVHIDAASSVAAFEKLEAYYPDSYNWPVSDRVRILTKLYQGSMELDQVRGKFFYAEKLGVLYREMDSLDLALHYLNAAVNEAYDEKSSRIALNSSGGLHRKIGDYEGALKFYFSALEEARKLDDGSEAFPLGNISEVYSAIGDLQNAVKYLKQSIQVSQRLESPEKEYSLTYDYSYLAEYYDELDQRDSTDLYTEYMLENIRKIDTVTGNKFTDAKFVAFYALTNISLNRANRADASKYLALSEKYAQSFYMSSIYILKARLLMLKNDFSAALALLNEDEVRLDQTINAETLALKEECYSSLGQFQKALEVNRELSQYQKTIFTNAQARFASFANVKFETLKKNEEINSLRQESEISEMAIKNQRYFVLTSLCLSLLLIGGLFFLWLRYKNKQKVNAYLQEEVDRRTIDLKKANDELRLLNYVASHDIKEPLRTIGSYSGLIQKKMNASEASKYHNHFSFINKSVKQTYSLIEDIAAIQEVYDLNEFGLSELSLNELIDNIFVSIDSLAKEKNANLTRTDFPDILSHSSMLYSIIKNLIENAIKFNESDRPEVKLDYTMQENSHLISVIDNGIGIDEKYKEDIFKNFKTLHNKSKYTGSGLGLSIASALIAKLNGEITVENRNDKGGSIFTVRLPQVA